MDARNGDEKGKGKNNKGLKRTLKKKEKEMERK